jgi:outer membrane receptor protein involved in Fe transport
VGPLLSGQSNFPNFDCVPDFDPAVFWWPLLSTASVNPGVPVPFTVAVPPEWEGTTQFAINHSSYGFFAQDQWKVSKNFTLTYGLRYDFESYGDRFLSEKDLNNFQPRVGIAYATNHKGVVRAASESSMIVSRRVWASCSTQLNG